MDLIEAGASGLKDSGNDVKNFKGYLEVADKKSFNAMPGSGSTMLDCFKAGAKAIVAGTSVAFPLEVLNLYYAILKNEKLINSRGITGKNKYMQSAANE